MRKTLDAFVIVTSISVQIIGATEASAASGRTVQVEAFDLFAAEMVDEPPSAVYPATSVGRDAKATARFVVHSLPLSPRGEGYLPSNGRQAEQPGSVPKQPLSRLSAPTIAIPGWMQAAPLVTPVPNANRHECVDVAYRPAGFLHPDVEIRRSVYYSAMSDAACAFGVPVGLFDALILQESRYRPQATSIKRAFGLAQLMPGTALDLGVDRYDVAANLRGGAKYLRQQLDRFGQFHLALAAYNAGPGRVQGGLVPRIPETQSYVSSILRTWSRLADRSDAGRVIVSGETARPAPAFRTASISTY